MWAPPELSLQLYSSESLLRGLLLQLPLVEQAAGLHILLHKHVHALLALQKPVIDLHQQKVVNGIWDTC